MLQHNRTGIKSQMRSDGRAFVCAAAMRSVARTKGDGDDERAVWTKRSIPTDIAWHPICERTTYFASSPFFLLHYSTRITLGCTAQEVRIIIIAF